MRAVSMMAVALVISACQAEEVVRAAPPAVGKSTISQIQARGDRVDPALLAQRQALWAKLEQRIGDGACDSSDQCRVIAYGHRACGGPVGYLVYSTKQTDTAALKADVDAYNRADKAAQPPGMVSTCQMLLAPRPVCRAGHCVGEQATSGPGEVEAQ